MTSRRRTRLSVLLASLAVAAATFVPVLPAAAEEPPTPDPVVTETATPEPTETAEPETETPETPAATTVDLTGSFVQLADEGGADSSGAGVRIFDAVGVGLVMVDAGSIAATGTLTLTVTVPTGVDATDLLAVRDYSVLTAPLAVVTAVPAEQFSAMVNQTPITSATHKIYAVLVTPSNVAGSAAAANQTAAKVQTSVTHADDYWSQQSGGTIHFSLAGTTAWYKGAASCVDAPNTNNANSVALWNEAAGKASTQLGYVPGPNTHLVLFFPSGANCNGPIGLGSIGRAVNIGGRAWVVGTDAAVEQATLAHELGHNLSLGHADWLNCSSSAPNPGFYGTACEVNEYGDLTDVMSFGYPGYYGAALSAPQAIRSSIWPTSAFVNAPKGTKSYALKPVSGNTGLRSVIVEDSTGVSYFVEFRNYTDEDVRAGAECSTVDGYCAVNRPGVRILRLAQDGDLYKGLPGDDSYLVGRTVAGTPRIDYLTNESFSLNGVTIKVTALSSAGATVSVTRNFTTASYHDIGFLPGVTYDETGIRRVGNTYGAMLGAGFIGDAETFQWYRNGVAISGATKQSYTLANADYQKTVSVRVTLVAKGYASKVVQATLGTVQAAVMTGSGSVSVTAPGTAPVKATPAGFPWGTTFTYQWFRGATAIAGATAATYTPVAADAGQQVKVRVTPTSAGNSLLPVESTSFDYRLDTDGSVFGIAGTAKVGTTLTAPNVGYRSSIGTGVTVAKSYVWYRSGVVIAGAIGATYPLVAADAGKTISVKVTASAAGYVSNVTTTTPTGTVALGTIQGSKVGPNLTKTGTTTTTVKLTAAPQSGSITETGVTYKYQWYRSVPAGTPELAIAGATASSYTLTTADYNKLVWLNITVSKPGYASEVLGSARLNYSVTATDTPVIAGNQRVGEYLTVNTLTWGVVAPASVAYTWYANGVAVQSGASGSYLLKAADYAKKITVKVTGAAPGYLSLALTSSATGAIAKGQFLGGLTASVTQNGRILTAVPGGLAPVPAYTYQWLRNGAAIAGATKAIYTLAAADYAKTISVKVTAGLLNYVAPVPPSLTTSSNLYSILAVGAPVITGEVRKGAMLSVTLPTYTVDGSNTSPSSTGYQWLRAGAVITGANGPTYTPVAADLNKAISVRVTAGYVSGARDLLPAVQTSGATQPVGTNTLAGWNTVSSLTVQHAGLVLSLASDATGISEGGTTKAYQWFRSGAAIAGATKASYTLTAADTGKTVYVRVITSKPTFTTIVKLSPQINYTVTQDAPPYLDQLGGGGKVGTTLAVGTGAYSAEGAPISVALSYTWLRNGVAIAGIPVTQDSYTLTPTDLGKQITVRVVASGGSGYLPLTSTTAAVAVVAGTIAAQDIAPTRVNEPTPTSLKTTATYTGTITAPGVVTIAYQWYRNGTAIAGATSATYTRTYLDNGTGTSVSAVLSAPGYTTRTLTQSASEIGTAVTASSGSVSVSDSTPVRNQTLSVVSTLAYTPSGASLTYQWYLNGAAVSGATGATFKVPTSALNKTVSVRVIAGSAGYVPFSSLSAVTGKVK